MLCVIAVWLAYKWPLPKSRSAAPPAPVLLPIAEVTPSWDGSYPFLTIRAADSGKGAARFEVSVSQLKPSVRHEVTVNEFQVDLHSGMFVLRQTDLFVPDSMPLVLTRTYHSWDAYVRAFGVGTNHPYDICPTGTRFPYTYQDLNLEDGRQIHFPRVSEGTGYADAVFRHYETSSEFYGAQDAWNGDGWTLDFRDGRRFIFPEAYNAKSFAQGAATEMRDSTGNRIQLKRDKVRDLEQLVSPSGHVINFEYDTASRIVQAADESGNVRRYDYDATGHIATVSDATNVLYRFRYQHLLNEHGYDPYLMTEVRDGRDRVLLHNEFADHSRVSLQRLADGQVVRYEYLFNRRYDIVETTVTLPDGKKRSFFFRDGKPTKKR
jgi:YD repeat-containing protein